MRRGERKCRRRTNNGLMEYKAVRRRGVKGGEKKERRGEERGEERGERRGEERREERRGEEDSRGG